MLYLTRKIGESIIINNNIELTIVEVRGKTVKIGFLFPKEATILRKELHQKILDQNLQATGGGEDDLLTLEFNLDDINKSSQPQQYAKEKGDIDGNR